MQINSHRQELKRRILDAAMALFSREGIKQVRMDDIARSLSISKRTLYEIYENKEQLLMDVVMFKEKKHLKSMEDFVAKGSNTIEIMVEGYRLQMKELSVVNPAFFEDLEAYSKVKEYFRGEHDKRRGKGRQFVMKGIEDGYFMSNLNYEVLAMVMDAASEYIMNANMYKKYGVKALFHNFVIVFLRGVCTAKGIALLDDLIQKVDDE